MLTGGPARVTSRGLSIAAITADALVVRQKTVKEGSRRAIFMWIAVAVTPGENLLYTLGGTDTYYDVWGSYLPAKQKQMVQEILGRAVEKRSEDGR
jgi:hypothetical protein